MEEEVDFLRGSFEEAIQRVDEIPGIGCRNAQEILAETGLDMGRFPSAAHFAS
jgi:transposase